MGGPLSDDDHQHEAFQPGRQFVPPWYRLKVRPLAGGDPVEVDVFEVIRAAGLDFQGGCVVKYALRAGKKPSATEAADRDKAAESAVRWVESGRMDD